MATRSSRRTRARDFSCIKTLVDRVLSRRGLAETAAEAIPAWNLETLEPRVMLSVVPIATPQFVVHAANPVQHASATSSVGMSPSTLDTAYGINAVTFGSVKGNGAGQTIAIVDAYNDPNIAADLSTFDAAYGLSNPTLTVVNENGSTSSLPGTDPAGKGNSWAVEISLDVEWAHAAAPGANILLVEAASANYGDLMTAVSTARSYTGGSVVSMSWGGNEFTGESAYDSYFTTPSGHAGVTFVASSGDTGGIVEYPASSINVLAVGGTSLTTSAGGAYASESGWSGAGGGISRYELRPAFQTGVVTQSTTYRTVPDVAADADPSTGVGVVDSWDFGTASPWVQVGGTSLSAPIWAGIIAIANQGRATSGQATLTGTQTLSKLYTLPASDFHDITTGSNGFSAGTGYDLVTGRGSPIVNLLAPALAGTTVSTSSPIIGSFTVSPTSVTAGTSVTLTASNVTDTGSTITGVTFYRESNTTSGLQIGTGGDTLLTGTITHSGTTWSLTTSTAGLTGGTYTYYAVAADAASVASSTASATLKVTAPAPAPVIGSFTVSPTTVAPGAALVLTASNVTDAGSTITGVTFYRESNGVTGLQTGTGGDTLLTGTVTHSGATWSLTASTTGLTTGTYTYYAVATDAASVASAAASATVKVTAPASAPANDNFANATVLSGTSISVTGTNVGATKQTGEPTVAANKGGASVWYSWTATVSGTVALNTRGSNFDTLLGVYTGTAVNSLTLVASNDDDTANHLLTSALTFKAVAGTTYHFVVDGFSGATGSINLNLTETASTTTTKTNSGTSPHAHLHLGAYAVRANAQGNLIEVVDAHGAAAWYSWSLNSNGTVTLVVHNN